MRESSMNEKDWDKRLLDLLKQKADEIKSETQRLVEEVRDPETQRKMKERLREFGTWAKQTAEEAAEKLEAAVKKAETAFTQRIEGTSDAPHTQAPTSAEAATPPEESASKGTVSRRGSPKTVGKSKQSAAGKGRAQHPVKTIGKKK